MTASHRHASDAKVCLTTQGSSKNQSEGVESASEFVTSIALKVKPFPHCQIRRLSLLQPTKIGGSKGEHGVSTRRHLICQLRNVAAVKPIDPLASWDLLPFVQKYEVESASEFVPSIVPKLKPFTHCEIRRLGFVQSTTTGGSTGGHGVSARRHLIRHLRNVAAVKPVDPQEIWDLLPSVPKIEVENEPEFVPSIVPKLKPFPRCEIRRLGFLRSMTTGGSKGEHGVSARRPLICQLRNVAAVKPIDAQTSWDLLPSVQTHEVAYRRHLAQNVGLTSWTSSQSNLSRSPARAKRDLGRKQVITMAGCAGQSLRAKHRNMDGQVVAIMAIASISPKVPSVPRPDGAGQRSQARRLIWPAVACQ